MFDAEQRLAAWNRNFQQLLDLPDTLLAERPGLGDYIRHLAHAWRVRRGRCRSRSPPSDRSSRQTIFDRAHAPDGRVIEVRANPVPGGGSSSTTATSPSGSAPRPRSARRVTRPRRRCTNWRRRRPISPRPGRRRGSDAGQVDVPRQYEPRDPDADERHHRAVQPRALECTRLHEQRDYLAKIHTAACRCSASSTTFSISRRSKPAR